MGWSWLSFFKEKVTSLYPYLILMPIVGSSQYGDKSGYQYLASGLCCGLSSLVHKFHFDSLFHRLLVWLLELSVMQVWEQTLSRRQSSWVWSWFWSSLKPWDCMVWLLLSSWLSEFRKSYRGYCLKTHLQLTLMINAIYIDSYIIHSNK
jgi:hypothetical protein